MNQTSKKKVTEKPDLMSMIGAGSAVSIVGGGHAKVDLSQPDNTPIVGTEPPANTQSPANSEPPANTTPADKTDEARADKKNTRGRPKNPPKDEPLTVLTIRIPESLNDLFISATHAHWRRTKNKAGIQSVLAPALISAIRKFANEEGVKE